MARSVLCLGIGTFIPDLNLFMYFPFVIIMGSKTNRDAFFLSLTYISANPIVITVRLLASPIVTLSCTEFTLYSVHIMHTNSVFSKETVKL